MENSCGNLFSGGSPFEKLILKNGIKDSHDLKRVFVQLCYKDTGVLARHFLPSERAFEMAGILDQKYKSYVDSLK